MAPLAPLFWSSSNSPSSPQVLEELQLIGKSVEADSRERQRDAGEEQSVRLL